MVHEYCAACGFDGAVYDDKSLINSLRALGPRWAAMISGAGTELHERPAPAVWSAIEYAAHSRDITALHVFGVEQALTLDEPAFPAIGDGLVEAAAAGYAGSDPVMVVNEIGQETTRLAQIADDAGPAAWSRGLTIGDNRSDVRRLLEHALHDSLHHLGDVERGLTQLRG